MKTKKRFMNLEIRKPLVKAETGLQVCVWGGLGGRELETTE